MQTNVGDVFRMRGRFSGGYRVWKVDGVHLGATHQESVVSLTCLDRSAPPETGNILVPVDILEAAGLEPM